MLLFEIRIVEWDLANGLGFDGRSRWGHLDGGALQHSVERFAPEASAETDDSGHTFLSHVIEPIAATGMMGPARYAGPTVAAGAL